MKNSIINYNWGNSVGLIGLIGVLTTLVALGIWFQFQEQKRVSAKAEKRQFLTNEQNREETLQNYFDHVEQLIIENDLIALWLSVVGSNSIIESPFYVIRARTLSVLRSFSGDKKRKASVVLFLYEASILKALNNLLNGADLSEADLSGSNLSEAYLFGSNLSEADFRGSNLSGAYLFGSNLSGADLSGSKLSGAYLFGSNLSEANLREADLSDAELLGSDLIASDLSGANLIGSDLRGANFTGANLTGAKFEKTICPDGQETDTGCPVA